MNLDDLFGELNKLDSSPQDKETGEEKERTNGDKAQDIVDSLELNSVVNTDKTEESGESSELPNEDEVLEETEQIEVKAEPALKLCRHDCKCGKSWSHMITPEECAARQLTEDNTCPDCVVNDNRAKVPDSAILSWEVQVNNSEIARCCNMTTDQLIEHIKQMQKQINELRIRQQRSRALLAERMEQDFTEEERADFRKTLKNVEKKEKKEKARTKVAGNQKDKAIKSLMNALGISEEKARKMVEGD